MKEVDENGVLNRRGFLKGTLGASLLGAGGLLTACSPTSASQAGQDADGATPTTSSDASPRYSWEVKPEPIADIANTVEADIVVIGAGIAGVNTASAAAAAGAKVVVLEQSDTWTAHGADIGAVESTYQKENGINLDKRGILKYLSQWAHESIDQNLVRIWLDRSGEMIDELAEICIAAGAPPRSALGTRGKLDDLEPYYRQYSTAHSFGSITSEEMVAGAWPMLVVVEALYEDALAHGAEFFFNTRAEQLVQAADGVVTGVVAPGEDGTYIQYNASKGVVLCTGDIGGNEEMIKAWVPVWEFVGPTMYTPLNGNMGDGHKMALWAGAAMQTAEPAIMVHALNPAQPLQPGDIGWLQVNCNGQRFHSEEPNEVSNSNARLTQPKHLAYFIYDGDYPAKTLAMFPENRGQFGVLVDENTEAAIDAAVETGLLYKADTLEDLAAQLDIPPDNLKQTVNRYNELCATGDDEDFGKREKWLTHTTVETPPFIAGLVSFAPFVVPYGLNVDIHSRVCNADSEPIDNLYAVGNTQGNFFAYDYPLLTPGVSHGRCVTFGRLLGKALANGKLI